MKYYGSLILALLLASSTLASDFGLIRGVVSGPDGATVGRATLTLDKGPAVLADSNGKFTLYGVKAGEHSLRVTAIGFLPDERTLTVKAGVNELGTITLKLAETAEELRVVGSFLQGQAAAVEAQRLADNIKNIVASDRIGAFPDSNAAEATQRIPGIFTARDQGEGRYVQVRGTEARLNKTTINSQDVPSPEGDLRTVALDVIPVDMLEAIEVSKAVTPDMDGDSVGGTVDLIVKKAPYQNVNSVGLEYGYNDLANDDLKAAEFLFGRRFMSDKLGLIATGSFEDSNRATDNFEAEYDDGLPEEFELRDYEVRRERKGAHVALDYDASSQLNFTLNASYSQFDDDEERRRFRYRMSDDRLERELKDRFESQIISAVQLKSTYFTQTGAIFDWSLGHSYARESEPDRVDTTFRQDDVEFNPNWSNGSFDGYNILPNPVNEDYSAYGLDEIVAENNFSSDEHNAIKLSYEFPVSFGDANMARFKFGTKLRRKEKMRDNQVFVYEADDIFLSDYSDPNYAGDAILDGRYPMGPMVGDAIARGLLDGAEGEQDLEEETADYEVTEDQRALYAMTTVELGESWSILGGLRYEEIDADYVGYEVAYDEEGDFSGITRLEGDKKDDLVMPQLHATYKFSDMQQLRMAATRTYARASVYDQVPYRLLLREDLEMEVGNPNIDITDVWNLDLQYEHYFGKVGSATVGVFHKDMTDYIFVRQSEMDFEGETYEVTRPENGTEATLWGAEISFQKNFADLSSSLDGFGILFNYTYTDSDATLEDRDITLPGQTETIANLALTYETGGFSIRIANNYHGEYLAVVGGDAEEDIYQDKHSQWDLSASYRMNKTRFFLELINLNDETFSFYQGSKAFPIQYEQYKTWGRIGVKLDF